MYIYLYLMNISEANINRAEDIHNRYTVDTRWM
jgi:hypothetical protein